MVRKRKKVKQTQNPLLMDVEMKEDAYENEE
jgi:hypothetical protein